LSPGGTVEQAAGKVEIVTSAAKKPLMKTKLLPQR
jgi:hypothetical protein